MGTVRPALVLSHQPQSDRNAHLLLRAAKTIANGITARVVRDAVTNRQEFYQGEAEDNGKVLSTKEMADVPAGHYGDVMLTKDTSAIEPDVLEYKLYAPGVGPVLVFGVSGGGGREELLSMTQVSASVAAAAGAVPLGQVYP